MMHRRDMLGDIPLSLRQSVGGQENLRHVRNSLSPAGGLRAPTSPAPRRKSSIPDIPILSRTTQEQLSHSSYNRSVGLLSGQGRYLTAENFGHKLNVTGAVLRKKQVWTLIPQTTTNTVNADDLVVPAAPASINGSSSADTFVKCRYHDQECPVFYFLSCQHRFLSMDRHGNVTCDSERAGDEERFALVFATDQYNEPPWKAEHWGAYNILNVKHCYFLSADAQTNLLKGLNKPSAPTDYWSIHLHVHPPYVNLKHVHRGKFVKTSKTSQESSTVALTDTLPWGIEALFTLELVSRDKWAGPAVDDKTRGLASNINNPTAYAIRTHNGTYLTSTGQSHLVLAGGDKIPHDAVFFVVFWQGCLAFRDIEGRYLTAIGNEGLIKCKKTVLSRDELWTVTGSSPQIVLKGFTEKYVSAHRGSDLAVNQDEISEFETFQLENDLTGKHWRFKTVADKFWSVSDNTCVTCVDDPVSHVPLKNLSINNNAHHNIPIKEDRTLFDIIWLPNKHIAIQSVHNHKYLTLKINKQMFAAGPEISQKETFKLFLVNRPYIMLQGPDGYVGENTKSREGPLDATKINYEETYIDQISFDAYHFRTSGNLYWTLQPETNLIAAMPKSKLKSAPDAFYIILKESTRIVVQAVGNGKYIRLGAGKKLEAMEDDEGKATTWNI